MIAFLTLILAVIVHVASGNSGTGEWHDLDVNSAEVKEAAVPAMETINARSDSGFLLILLEIQSASGQVVAGMNYRLTLLVGQSNCTKLEVMLKRLIISSGV